MTILFIKKRKADSTATLMGINECETHTHSI